MFKKLLTTRSLCLSAIIAALYAALTLLLAPLAWGIVLGWAAANALHRHCFFSRCCRWFCRSPFPVCSWAA